MGNLACSTDTDTCTQSKEETTKLFTEVDVGKAPQNRRDKCTTESESSLDIIVFVFLCLCPGNYCLWLTTSWDRFLSHWAYVKNINKYKKIHIFIYLILCHQFRPLISIGINVIRVWINIKSSYSYIQPLTYLWLGGLTLVWYLVSGVQEGVASLNSWS